MIYRCSFARLARCLLILFGSLQWSMGGLLAQEYKYELGASLGTSYYMGDAVRRGPFGMHSVGLGGVGRYNLNFRSALVTTLGYLVLRGDSRLADNAFPEGRHAAFSTHSVQWSVGGEHNFLPLSDKYRYLQTSSWSPYIGGGGLLALAWGQEASALVPGVYLSCGLKYMLSSRVTLSAKWQIQYYLSDRLDALGRDNKWLANPFGLNRGIKGGDAAGLVSISLSYQMGLRNKSSCFAEW